MKRRFIIASALLLIGLAACAPDSPQSNSGVASANSASNSSPNLSTAAPRNSSANGSTVTTAHPSAAAPNDTLAPPKNAHYTIFCMSVTGEDHVALANQAKKVWSQATGRQDWYVIHQADQSNLYFGFYRSIAEPDDARESARAVADRQMVQNLKDSVGDLPFEHAILVPLQSPDPTAPAEWNLVNAKGYWSVEVAAFRGMPLPGSPDRKTAAVETVRDMRAHGIEAYYYNGDGVSCVCVGAWPKEAIDTPGGDSVQDPNSAHNIYSVPLQLANMFPEEAVDKEGNPTRIVHNQNTIVDASLLAVLKQYPSHALNGNDDNVQENGTTRTRPSFPVKIPHEDVQPANASAGGAAPPTVDLLGGSSSGGANSNANPNPSPSGGNLKSIGD